MKQRNVSYRISSELFELELKYVHRKKIAFRPWLRNVEIWGGGGGREQLPFVQIANCRKLFPGMRKSRFQSHVWKRQFWNLVGFFIMNYGEIICYKSETNMNKKIILLSLFPHWKKFQLYWLESNCQLACNIAMQCIVQAFSNWRGRQICGKD